MPNDAPIPIEDLPNDKLEALAEVLFDLGRSEQDRRDRDRALDELQRRGWPW
ncbi:hypothetical protein ACQEUU_37770 [Nonomuraea sp. CA-218870]|uniref:hypothetical protein n=1 Tax=Nonomuraea sp. CA-218870 TaxID=3239998 RepID=UPI003D8BFA3A